LRLKVLYCVVCCVHSILSEHLYSVNIYTSDLTLCTHTLLTNIPVHLIPFFTLFDSLFSFQHYADV
jgi:hypothetical protein